MEQKAWVISVNMGYGHQRTAYPLKYLAFGGKIINANNYQGIPEKDKKTWEDSRNFYEFISSFGRIPLIGKFIFSIFDQFQKIFSFYPKRDLSKQNLQLNYIFSLIKKGWGKHLIEKLSSTRATANGEEETIVSSSGQPLPLISTFFTPAFMAEYFNYPGEIFCVVCDADISRTWASINPNLSKIKYFAPTLRVVERLKLYGVKPQNIFFTGFPLPVEIIERHLATTQEELQILKQDLQYRLLNLDPQKKYFEKYQILIEAKIGKLPEKSNHPLTIMFSIGGAGAQKEIGVKALKCLILKIKQEKVKIILAAGIKEKVKEYFLENIKKLGLEEQLNKNNIKIIFAHDIEAYFQEFNQALRTTDILWTKPSELSFYAALGLPIIIAPPIGSQEDFNKRWLLKSGFGIPQEDPVHVDQWLFDWIDRGYLAESAAQGFIEGEKLGTLNIKKIISPR